MTKFRRGDIVAIITKKFAMHSWVEAEICAVVATIKHEDKIAGLVVADSVSLFSGPDKSRTVMFDDRGPEIRLATPKEIRYFINDVAQKLETYIGVNTPKLRAADAIRDMILQHVDSNPTILVQTGPAITKLNDGQMMQGSVYGGGIVKVEPDNYLGSTTNLSYQLNDVVPSNQHQAFVPGQKVVITVEGINLTIESYITDEFSHKDYNREEDYPYAKYTFPIVPWFDENDIYMFCRNYYKGDRRVVSVFKMRNSIDLNFMNDESKSNVEKVKHIHNSIEIDSFLSNPIDNDRTKNFACCLMSKITALSDALNQAMETLKAIDAKYTSSPDSAE